MKRFLLFFIFFFSLSTYSQEVNINYIKYKLNKEKGTAEVVVYTYWNEIVIPEIVSYEGKDYLVTSIANNVFSKTKGITSITIPKSIKSIGYGAFADCNKLKEVNISDIAAWCNIDFMALT